MDPLTLLVRTLLIFAPVLGGCTSISIQHREDATVEVQRYIGLAVVQLAPGDHGTIIYSTTGLGATVGPQGANLGWWKSVSAAIASAGRCQVVIWTESHLEVERISNLLRREGLSLDQVCLIGEGAKK